MPRSEHPLKRIEPALDRFREAHFWIHMLESHYHHSEQFRWHLNVFLKAIKEVPQLIRMGLQHEPGFKVWFEERVEKLHADPLIHFLSKQRDTVVHKGMLVPNSHGSIGITEGRGFKLGMTYPVHPLEDSVDAMERYLYFVAQNDDFLGILTIDEDSMPCVHRSWKLPEFDDDLVDLAAAAWLRLGETVGEVVQWLGVESDPLALDCRHSAQSVQFRLFNRDKLLTRLEQIRKAPCPGFVPIDGAPSDL